MSPKNAQQKYFDTKRAKRTKIINYRSNIAKNRYAKKNGGEIVCKQKNDVVSVYFLIGRANSSTKFFGALFDAKNDIITYGNKNVGQNNKMKLIPIRTKI